MADWFEDGAQKKKANSAGASIEAVAGGRSGEGQDGGDPVSQGGADSSGFFSDAPDGGQANIEMTVKQGYDAMKGYGDDLMAAGAVVATKDIEAGLVLGAIGGGVHVVANVGTVVNGMVNDHYDAKDKANHQKTLDDIKAIKSGPPNKHHGKKDED
jgi:hypothetical protein